MAVLTAPSETGAPRDHKRGSDRGALARAVRRNLGAHGFLIGALLCFVLFSWYPMVREVIMSFQRTKAGRTTWDGWHNFSQVYHDPSFWQAWRNTAEFTLIALVLGYLVPFFAAIVLNELRHFKGLLRVLVYLPVMLPPVSALFIWRYMLYDPQYGMLNRVLHAVGLPTSEWVQSPHVAMLCVVVASTWMNMGSATLIYLAALQNIPGELYEAAELDGAGVLSRIWHVTIPQTRLILSMMLMMQIVATMQVFVEPFVLTNGGQGVDGSTQTIVYLIYQYAFSYGNYGAACALGLMLLLVLAIFSVLYVRINRKLED